MIHRLPEKLRAYASMLLRWWHSLPPVVTVILVAAAWVTLSTAYGWHFITVHLPFSNQDEYTYVDYVEKASRGVLLRRNMYIDQYTANELACRGMEFVGKFLPGCGGDVPIRDLPIGGFSSGSIHSPLYFWVTAALAKVVMAVTGSGLIAAARITGALWLGLGITTLCYLLREVGASRTVAFSAGLLTLASPQAWWSNFYVTPDALNILAGASIILAAVRFDRGKNSSLWFIGLSVVMSIVKFQEAFAAIACAVYFIVRWLCDSDARQDSHRRRAAACGLFAAVLGVVAQFTWQWLRLRIALPAPPGSDYVMDPPAPFSLRQALDQADAFLLNLYVGPVSVMSSQHAVHAHVALAGLLVISTLVAAVLFGGKGAVDREGRILAGAMLLSVVCAGPLFYTYIAVTSDTAFGLPPRYGGALFPALFVGFPYVLRQRGAAYAVLAFSVMVALAAWAGNALA